MRSQTDEDIGSLIFGDLTHGEVATRHADTDSHYIVSVKTPKHGTTTAKGTLRGAIHQASFKAWEIEQASQQRSGQR